MCDWMYMYIHKHIYIHTYIHTYTERERGVEICYLCAMCVYVREGTFCACLNVHLCACNMPHARIAKLRVCLRDATMLGYASIFHLCMCVYLCVHTYIHICVYTWRMYVYIYMYMYT